MKFFFIFIFYTLFSCSLFSEETGNHIKILSSLEEAEQLALNNNNQVKQLTSLVNQAKQERLIRISDWLPRLELVSASFHSEKKLDTGTKNSFLTQLAVSQTIFASKKYYNIKIADLVLNQMKILKSAKVNDVLYEIRRAYYQVLLDQKLLDIAAMRVEVFKTLAIRVEDRLNIGTADSLNVNQSQILVANALASFYNVQKQLEISQNILSQVLGYDPGTIKIQFQQKNIDPEEVSGLTSYFDKQKDIFLDTPTSFGLIYPPSNPSNQTQFINHFFSKEDVLKWEKTALNFRPSLRNAHKIWEIAREEVRKAWGLYYPEIDFETGYGGYPGASNGAFGFPGSPSGYFDRQKFYGSVGVTFKWNLFDSLKRERTIRAAQDEMSADKYSWDYQIQEAYRSVRDEIASIESAVATYLASKGGIRLAEQTLAQAAEEVDIGYISIFDYQNAVNNLIETQTIFFQSQFDVINSYFGLRFASGIDVKTSNKN